MLWRPKDWHNPCDGCNCSICESGHHLYEAGADALLQSLLDSGIIKIEELEALNKNGDEQRNPQ